MIVATVKGFTLVLIEVQDEDLPPVCRYLTAANKVNLRDLIAATSLVILLKLDSNHQFFSLCDLEIWWMTLKNKKTPLSYNIKLCASFQSHRWIQTGVTVRKRPIRVKIGDFFVPDDLEIWRMTLKDNRTPFLSMYHQTLCIISSPHVNSNSSYSPETAKLSIDLLDLWPLTSDLDLLHLSMVITTENFRMIQW